MGFHGKSVLVTGGASGFGAAIATRFAEAGGNVVIMDLDGDRAQALAGSIGARAVRGDVTSRADIVTAVAAARAETGRVDIVINNAGWTHRNKPLTDVQDEEFDRIFAINVKAIFLMTQAVVPAMREAGGGVILNIGSTAGLRPRPGLTWYNASKGAVNLLSQSMAVELAPDRIRVNCVAPVIGNTALLESFLGKPDTPDARAAFVRTIPLGRLCEPSDVAAACLFLASDDAEFITGVILPVDGGRTV